MKNITPLVIWFVIGSLLASHALAREGVIRGRDRCFVGVGPYFMSYKGYQPETQSYTPFCVDVPAAGRTLIVLDVEQNSGGMGFTSDFYNELRDMALDFRILRNVGQADDEDNMEQNTEAYLPPQKYPMGTLQFEHIFTKTGNFIGLVSARDYHGRVFVSRFPFTVGPTFGAFPYVVGGLVLAAAAAGFFLARRRSAALSRAIFN
jgi:hypothetical protein